MTLTAPPVSPTGRERPCRPAVRTTPIGRRSDTPVITRMSRLFRSLKHFYLNALTGEVRERGVDLFPAAALPENTTPFTAACVQAYLDRTPLPRSGPLQPLVGATESRNEMMICCTTPIPETFPSTNPCT
jgi:hypothetical protein